MVGQMKPFRLALALDGVSVAIRRFSFRDKVAFQPTILTKSSNAGLLHQKVESYDDEKRIWSNIKGIPRDKVETVEWLQHLVNGRVDVATVARELGIVSRHAASEHVNWNALVQYLTMYHAAATNTKWSKRLVRSVLMQNVLTKTNGF
ncbi:unnamed protein product [Phytophthora fragariaefolia]|uniref:Unnamed protein product n=1 Tax=Phytophthora fragariaefolia TaxID=1490495 RepID=A0A9W6Y914_9STRA|nr:unnamed protein product [Phytophthora fragariaefolia]